LLSSQAHSLRRLDFIFYPQPATHFSLALGQLAPHLSEILTTWMTPQFAAELMAHAARPKVVWEGWTWGSEDQGEGVVALSEVTHWYAPASDHIHLEITSKVKVTDKVLAAFLQSIGEWVDGVIEIKELAGGGVPSLRNWALTAEAVRKKGAHLILSFADLTGASSISFGADRSHAMLHQ
jgi:hypothetical protein